MIRIASEVKKAYGWYGREAPQAGFVRGHPATRNAVPGDWLFIPEWIVRYTPV